MRPPRKSNEPPSVFVSSPVFTVPTKTFDGGSHSASHRDGVSFDAFQHYSDDRVRMSVLMMRGEGSPPLEQSSLGSDSGVLGTGASRCRQKARNATAANSATTSPQVNRKTAISFELHHSVFSSDNMRILHGTTGKAQ